MAAFNANTAASFASACPTVSGDIWRTTPSISSYRPGCWSAQAKYSSTVMRLGVWMFMRRL